MTDNTRFGRKADGENNVPLTASDELSRRTSSANRRGGRTIRSETSTDRMSARIFADAINGGQKIARRVKLMNSRASGTAKATIEMQPRKYEPSLAFSGSDAGAGTTPPLQPNCRLSPQLDSAERQRRKTKHVVQSKTLLSSFNSLPETPAGRATVAVQTDLAMRDPTSLPGRSGRRHQVKVNQPSKLCTVESLLTDQRGHSSSDTRLPFSALIDEAREQWKRRQMWHRAEKSLTLQAKAFCRRLAFVHLRQTQAAFAQLPELKQRALVVKESETVYGSANGDGKHPCAPDAFMAMTPLLGARNVIETSRKQVEKRGRTLMESLLDFLPNVRKFVEETRGFGLLSLFGIVGEAGDLANYANPAKLWKRMGLAVIDGKRQRRVAGAEAILHGYNPARRSLVWTIGDSIIKAGGPLKAVYNTRKELELTRVATKMHAHNRAKRYMEKRLLLLLWRAWRDRPHAVTHLDCVAPSFSNDKDAIP